MCKFYFFGRLPCCLNEDIQVEFNELQKELQCRNLQPFSFLEMDFMWQKNTKKCMVLNYKKNLIWLKIFYSYRMVLFRVFRDSFLPRSEFWKLGLVVKCCVKCIFLFCHLCGCIPNCKIRYSFLKYRFLKCFLFLATLLYKPDLWCSELIIIQSTDYATRVVDLWTTSWVNMSLSSASLIMLFAQFVSLGGWLFLGRFAAVPCFVCWTELC